jgi:putative molybdopterin biosynthesis protein
MVEYTSRRGGTVTFFRGVAPSENVASSGSDVQIGEMVLRQGTAIGPREVAILSAIGLASVQVFRRPRVGIISTGDELVPPGAALSFGKIYDVNSTSLIAAVEEAGGEGIYYDHADDDYAGIKSAIEDAVKEFDLVLISGGTSAGTGDLVYRVLEDICTPGILVHGLRVKPGKPTIIASHNGKAVIGLPGYPVSALMIFDQLVKPFIELVAGNSARPAHLQRGHLAQRVNGAKGRRWLLPVHVINSRESPVVYPIIASSGATSALAKADGYVVISEDDEYVDAGEEVVVRLFPGERRPDLVIMGSHCPGLDILLQMLYRQGGTRAKTANIGSQGGFAAVSRGRRTLLAPTCSTQKPCPTTRRTWHSTASAAAAS